MVRRNRVQTSKERNSLSVFHAVAAQPSTDLPQSLSSVRSDSELEILSNNYKVSIIQAIGGLGGGIKAYVAANQVHDELRTILVYASFPLLQFLPTNYIRTLDVAHW